MLEKNGSCRNPVVIGSIKLLKSVCINIKRRVEDRQHEFCIDIWFLIITSKMHSVLRAL